MMSVELVSQEEQELIDDYKSCCFEVTQHLLGLFDVDDDAIDEMVNGHYRSAEGYLHEFKKLTQRKVEAERRLKERGIPLPDLY